MYELAISDESRIAIMQDALDRVWTIALGAKYSLSEIADLHDRCMEATPHTDESPSLLNAAASDAGVVVANALRSTAVEGAAASDAAANVVALLDNLFGPGSDETDEVPEPISAELVRQNSTLTILEGGEVDRRALEQVGRALALREEVREAAA